jgi:hypothetical protein
MARLLGRITRLEQRITPVPGCATCSRGDPIQFTLRLLRGETIPDVCPTCACPPPRPSIYVLRQLIHEADAADAMAEMPTTKRCVRGPSD